ERVKGTIGYETFPALKIARLAVDKRHQRSGLGTLLIQYAVAKSIHMRDNVCGVRFITLDCFSHRLTYYTSDKIKFTQNKEQSNTGSILKPISLRLDIDEYLNRINI
ncbi:MAG: hypothetical protein JWM44_657, partial [Bacilli bacterium]|nr:hypothetical protein [Bacilli bacterium]